MRTTRIVMMVAAVNLVGFATSIGASATRPAMPRVPLPANITIDDALRARVEEGIALSPTLGRQVAVIARAPARVEVRASLAPRPSLRRAETTIGRYESGFILAQVTLPTGWEFLELLAHELEHVVEQIEGVKLDALERTGGATRDASGVFETVRARDAGRAAAAEVEGALRALEAPQH